LNERPDSQPIIVCKDVRKSFGRFEALRSISLSIGRGEVV
jgi:ABC-type sugar transport system ATPase subunit